MSYSYQNAIAALIAQGYPVDAGNIWGPISQKSWWQFVRSTAYATGKTVSEINAGYGFAYTGTVDAGFSEGVASGTGYVVAVNSYPISQSHSYPFNFQVSAQSGGVATSFSWNFGDTNTQVTTTGYVSHTYSAAGTYNPTVTPTVNGSPVGPFAVPSVTAQ